MRISSIQIFNIANNSMADANEALVKTQEQLSTGLRVLNPSDDPVAATKIMALETELSTIEQYQKNINIGKNNLTLEESVLDGVNNLIQRIQELAIQAGNTATLSTSEYQSIANEVDARIGELQNLLNNQNANGDYIFGGYKTSEPPFTGNAQTGFQYNGDEGQQFVKVANSTTVAMSDSGKDLFVDIASDQNTFNTSVSPTNLSNPPISVTVGQVVNQDLYDEFYPEDIIITFNADTNISPPAKNYTAYERSTGQIIVENQRYSSGGDISINGVSFQILGDPVSGVAAVPATSLFGSDTAQSFVNGNFLGAPETFEIVVAGRVETFVLDDNITNAAELATVLNDATNGTGFADSNAEKLARLGLTVDSTGFSMADGVNFTIRNPSAAAVDEVLGIDTLSVSTTTNGEVAQDGDEVFIDSTNKQDILTTIARFSEAMKIYDGTDDTRGALEDVVNSTISNLGNAQTSVLEVTSKIGARLNTLVSTEQLHFDAELLSRELLADIRDVDYAEAASKLSVQTLILEAAQSSFVRVSRLSLFTQL